MKRRPVALTLGAIVALVVVASVAVLASTHFSIGNRSLGAMINTGGGGSGGGGGGGTPPRVKSIALDVSGSMGEIAVMSATVSQTVKITVSESDPNFKILMDLVKLTQDGNMSQAMRTMYLHYTYTDGSTSQTTLNQAYVSALTAGAQSGSSTPVYTATLNAKSITTS